MSSVFQLTWDKADLIRQINISIATWPSVFMSKLDEPLAFAHFVQLEGHLCYGQVHTAESRQEIFAPVTLVAVGCAEFVPDQVNHALIATAWHTTDTKGDRSSSQCRERSIPFTHQLMIFVNKLPIRVSISAIPKDGQQQEIQKWVGRLPHVQQGSKPIRPLSHSRFPWMWLWTCFSVFTCITTGLILTKN